MTTIDPETRVFAERLQLQRKRLGWTQSELADRIAAGQNTISKWEQGLSSPSIPKLLQLCKVFQVSSDYLIGKSVHPSGMPAGMYLVDQAVLENPVELEDLAVQIPDNPLILSPEEMVTVYKDAVKRLKRRKG